MEAKAFLLTRRAKVCANGTVRKIWTCPHEGLVAVPGGTGITDPIRRERRSGEGCVASCRSAEWYFNGGESRVTRLRTSR